MYTPYNAKTPAVKHGARRSFLRASFQRIDRGYHVPKNCQEIGFVYKIDSKYFLH